jgi:hypothetical protein
MPITSPSEPTRIPAAPARWRHAIPVGVAIGSLGLLGAGCGSSPGSPSGSTTPPTKDFASSAYRFSSCMRNHGVADFPDPRVSSGANGQVSVMVRITPSITGSPQFKAAQKACRGILPAPGNVSATQLAQQQHARAQNLLAFATCLRSHGVPGFPDPTSQGQLTLQMVKAAGVDLHAPAVLTAAKACIGVAHGAITAADVERAVNGGH